MKELKSICGVPIEELVKRNKRYNLMLSVLYTLDIVAVLGFTAYMFYHEITYEWYGYALVVVCMLVNMVVYYKLDTCAHVAYKFYRKYRSKPVREVKLRLTWVDMIESMKKAGFRVFASQTMPEMAKAAQLQCMKDFKLSCKFMKQFSQYEAEDGRITCLVVDIGKASYLLDFTEVFKEDENEHHHEGTVEESGSGSEHQRGSSD